ncbi:MAG: hypothetical protein B5M54_08610 [Candidatus Aminicenantes bacterium 4484_214]|nr:MAG: hypothetical protein B5M54_08610 [Candidatus Aminicenantes bacterium 4484_214]
MSHKTFCGSLIRPIKKFILSGSLREYQRTSSNKKRREEKRKEKKKKRRISNQLIDNFFFRLSSVLLGEMNT